MSYSLKIIAGTMTFYLIVFIIFSYVDITAYGFGIGPTVIDDYEPLEDVKEIEDDLGFFAATLNLILTGWELLIFMAKMTFTISGLPFWAHMLMKIPGILLGLGIIGWLRGV